MINTSRSEERPATLVVSNRIAARQWLIHLAAERVARGEQAWDSPSVMSFRVWTELLWRDCEGSASVLRDHQSRALWRRIVAESAAGTTLIDCAAAANWAASAWRTLCAEGIDPGAKENRLIGVASEEDYDTFLHWARAYDERLRAAKWLDAAQLSARLRDIDCPTRRAQAITADLAQTTRSQRALLDHLAGQGWRVEGPQLGSSAQLRKIRLSDARSELRAAIAWAIAYRKRCPSSRVAVVVRELSAQQTGLWRLWADLSDTRSIPYSSSPAGLISLDGVAGITRPLIAAAVNALELLSPAGTFAALSRWLRSPFFCVCESERAARSVLEAALRDHITTQLSFVTAYRRAGLQQRVRELAPAVDERISAALERLEHVSAPQPPAAWAATWAEVLGLLGWPGLGPDAELGDLHLWHDALEDFCQLMPVTGSLSLQPALKELGYLLERRVRQLEEPLAGLFVLSRPEDLGPGYDAVWVTGVTAGRWAQPAPLSPLLPRTLQRQTPGAQREAGRDALARLCTRARSVVLSWSLRGGSESEPSPVLAQIEELAAQQFAADEWRGRRAQRVRMRHQEVLADHAPALAGRVIGGGARVLTLQARCPLAAFCEQRLGARALPRIEPGVSAPLRGEAVHRALQHMLEPAAEQRGEIATIDAAEILASAREALHRVFGQARAVLPTLFALECDQLVRMLHALLAAERERGPFVVAALEAQRRLDVGQHVVKLRLDRIDRLADGSLAVLDYKTGLAAAPGEWLGARLHDAQIPLYALACGPETTAAVIALLAPGRVSYRGFWKGTGDFPGRPAMLPAGRSWGQQIELWQRQLAQLAKEFAKGDIRVDRSDYSEAAGYLAPLTRIFELAGDRGYESV